MLIWNECNKYAEKIPPPHWGIISKVQSVDDISDLMSLCFFVGSICQALKSCCSFNQNILLLGVILLKTVFHSLYGRFQNAIIIISAVSNFEFINVCFLLTIGTYLEIVVCGLYLWPCKVWFEKFLVQVSIYVFRGFHMQQKQTSLTYPKRPTYLSLKSGRHNLRENYLYNLRIVVIGALVYPL